MDDLRGQPRGYLAGVNRFRDGGFSVYGAKDGMTGNGAVSITEDAKGRIWFASTTGLTSLREGQFKMYGKRDGLLSENVRAVYVDSRARLWIGTLGGLQIFDGERFKAYTTEEGLSHNNVLFIREDREGSLWVGTPNGLNRMREDGRFDVFTTKDGLGAGSALWEAVLRAFAKASSRRSLRRADSATTPSRRYSKTTRKIFGWAARAAFCARD